MRLDVSNPASIEAARSRVADELGRVDILVNNAGIFEPQPGMISTLTYGNESWPST